MRAVVVGSGPNGLAAAITLAQAGLDVEVLEAAPTIGGGLRSAELTLPGVVHDVCSAIHPLALASPFFTALELPVEWVQPPAAAAHPFDDGSAVTLERRVEATAAQLGADAEAYMRAFGPLVARWDAVRPALLGAYPPAPRPAATLVRGLGSVALARALRLAGSDACSAAETLFRGEAARGLFAGHAAHSVLPLERRPSAGFALALSVLGHTVGWGFPRGGAQALADALAARLRALGGTVRTGERADVLPRADVVLCDVAPRELARLAGERLPPRYRVHLGGTLAEIAASERAHWRGEHAERPFVLLAQHTLFDPTRAPAGRHTAWAYCHVPHGANVDMTGRVEAQVERFAPGFRERVIARSVLTPRALEASNANEVGGDLNGGVMDLGQLLFRPTRRLVPYRTPLRGVYLCSASTPPGGGVHGLCGWSAARVALSDLR
jgi:phytoene dehydrogenase-like protein